MIRRIFIFFAAALCLLAPLLAIAQSGDDAIRVTVTMNPDGSKTIYETNGASHRSVATTTDANGKARGKIIYRLDNDGRYESGEVFSGSGAFHFRTLYHYNSAGQLADETQLDKAGAVLHKIVYTFDADGRPSGYAVYDDTGALLGRTTPRTSATPNGQRR